MGNTVEVRSPTVTIDGEATDDLTLSFTVPVSGGLSGSPFARYSFHEPAGEEAISPTTEELVGKIEAAQQEMFTNPELKSVTINDGVNQKIFTGYNVGGHHSVMFGNVANGRTLVHPCSRLDYMNTAIYVGGGKEAYLDKSRKIKSTTIPDLMAEVLDNIVADWEEFKGSSDDKTDDVTAAVRDSVHENNKAIFDTWNSVLSASTDVELEGFAEYVENESQRVTVAEKIAAVYQSSSPDFFSKIAQFESMFQIRFIPSPDGDTPGKFIPFKKMVSDAEDATINIRSLAMQAGTRGFMPVGAVVMTGLPRSAPYLGKATAGTAMVSHPETIPAGAAVETITAPSWIVSDLLPTIEEADISGNLDLNAYLSALGTLDDAADERQKSILKLAKDFARNVYCNIALSTSTASVVTLLDVTWEAGKRYKVTQDKEDATVLFSGFLQNVEHNISSSPSRANATTTLSFTHVEAGAFELPNK